MAKNVFLSFVAEDLDLVNLFRGQAKNKKSDLQFSDYSVQVPYNSKDADYIKSKIRERIRGCSATVCLIGATTATSSWVDWEIRESAKLGSKLIGVRLHSSASKDPTPRALADLKAKVLGWDIDAIVKELQ